MVAALVDLVPAAGEAVVDSTPFYSVGRYMGELLSEEAFKRGVAGRCPAVRMAFISDRSVRTTLGRKVDLVEGTFVAVVFSDKSKGKDDRLVILGLCERVQYALAARAFGLQIMPLRARQTTQFPGLEHCTAYGVTFTTRYRVDYSKYPGDDVMRTATGDIHVPNTDDAEGKIYGEIDVILPQESP